MSRSAGRLLPGSEWSAGAAGASPVRIGQILLHGRALQRLHVKEPEGGNIVRRRSDIELALFPQVKPDSAGCRPAPDDRAASERNGGNPRWCADSCGWLTRHSCGVRDPLASAE